MEKALHYWWKYRMGGSGGLRLADGRPVQILDPGLANPHAGPDFSNAKIIVDGIEWAGNVEIHVNASDWLIHRHHLDPAYDNIILHVVLSDDFRVHRTNGSEIPQLCVKLPDGYMKRFAKFSASESDLRGIRCSGRLSTLSRMHRISWIDRMGMERLISKADHVREIYDAAQFDWQQTSFSLLARTLGFGLNAEPFELLARTTPLAFLRRHADDPVKLEAIIFGQAGMLAPDREVDDDYFRLLKREYTFLSHKYSLRPLDAHLMKSGRTRPGNFPLRRLAALAAFLFDGFHIPDRILNAESLPPDPRTLMQLKNLFDVKPSEYWHGHSSFGIQSQEPAPTMSRGTLDLFLINFVVPLLYAHGTMRNNHRQTDDAVAILETLKPENNAIIRHWKSLGIEAGNAFESQALLHITRNYCNKGNCLHCCAAHQLLRSAIHEAEP